MCRPMPPAPGCHCGPVPWPRRPASSCQVLPPSVERNRAASSTPGVDGVGIGQRRLEVPDALELPRVLRAVVPLVRGERLAGLGRRVVDELVALALGHAVRRRGRLAGRRARLVPRLAAVVGALDDLPEPAAGLRRVDPVRIDGRALEVVDLPAGEVRAADVPPLSLAVRRQDERALARADQDSYPAHPLLLPEPSGDFMAGQPSTARAAPGCLLSLYSRIGRLEIDTGALPSAGMPATLPRHRLRRRTRARQGAAVPCWAARRRRAPPSWTRSSAPASGRSSTRVSGRR